MKNQDENLSNISSNICQICNPNEALRSQLNPRLITEILQKNEADALFVFHTGLAQM